MIDLTETDDEGTPVPKKEKQFKDPDPQSSDKIREPLRINSFIMNTANRYATQTIVSLYGVHSYPVNETVTCFISRLFKFSKCLRVGKILSERQTALIQRRRLILIESVCIWDYGHGLQGND